MCRLRQRSGLRWQAEERKQVRDQRLVNFENDAEEEHAYRKSLADGLSTLTQQMKEAHKFEQEFLDILRVAFKRPRTGDDWIFMLVQ